MVQARLWWWCSCKSRFHPKMKIVLPGVAVMSSSVASMQIKPYRTSQSWLWIQVRWVVLRSQKPVLPSSDSWLTGSSQSCRIFLYISFPMASCDHPGSQVQISCGLLSMRRNWESTRKLSIWMEVRKQPLPLNHAMNQSKSGFGRRVWGLRGSGIVTQCWRIGSSSFILVCHVSMLWRWVLWACGTGSMQGIVLKLDRKCATSATETPCKGADFRIALQIKPRSRIESKIGHRCYMALFTRLGPKRPDFCTFPSPIVLVCWYLVAHPLQDSEICTFF